ncbi:MAG: hypothetical protein RMJ28_06825 [Nitrososphaerota archaeon]|nr:hypothetical protein [Candidatus Calditenuaceae archaeon]MDW8073926.1 hypothetical protein [Nitrososphaerota archaeon]
MSNIGAIVNVISFNHPHIKSLVSEGLWGFPDDKPGSNKRRWEKLRRGDNILLYGEYRAVKGIWFLCELIDKRENRSPVNYWIQNPAGYPWQITIRPLFPTNKFNLSVLDSLDPIRKDELSQIGIKTFNQKLDRWSLLVFDRQEKYSYDLFQTILTEFKMRNEKIKPVRPDHETIKKIIYQVGVIQNRFPQTEYNLENRHIDVVWRRTPKSVPCTAFEIQIGGNIFEALAKLKHAFDIWNAIPVLITTDEQIEEAKKWVEGSFHELREAFRILTLQDVLEYYNMKQRAKEFERRIGLL